MCFKMERRDEGCESVDDEMALIPREDVVVSTRAAGPLCSTRYQLAFMGFLGFFLVYAMRISISVALVAMVKDTSDTDNDTVNEECPVRDQSNSSSTGCQKLANQIVNLSVHFALQ